MQHAAGLPHGYHPLQSAQVRQSDAHLVGSGTNGGAQSMQAGGAHNGPTGPPPPPPTQMPPAAPVLPIDLANAQPMFPDARRNEVSDALVNWNGGEPSANPAPAPELGLNPAVGTVPGPGPTPGHVEGFGARMEHAPHRGFGVGQGNYGEGPGYSPHQPLPQRHGEYPHTRLSDPSPPFGNTLDSARPPLGHVKTQPQPFMSSNVSHGTGYSSPSPHHRPNGYDSSPHKLMSGLSLNDSVRSPPPRPPQGHQRESPSVYHNKDRQLPPSHDKNNYRRYNNGPRHSSSPRHDAYCDEDEDHNGHRTSTAGYHRPSHRHSGPISRTDSVASEDNCGYYGSRSGSRSHNANRHPPPSLRHPEFERGGSRGGDKSVASEDNAGYYARDRAYGGGSRSSSSRDRDHISSRQYAPAPGTDRYGSKNSHGDSWDTVEEQRASAPDRTDSESAQVVSDWNDEPRSSHSGRHEDQSYGSRRSSSRRNTSSPTNRSSYRSSGGSRKSRESSRTRAPSPEKSYRSRDDYREPLTNSRSSYGYDRKERSDRNGRYSYDYDHDDNKGCPPTKYKETEASYRKTERYDDDDQYDSHKDRRIEYDPKHYRQGNPRGGSRHGRERSHGDDFYDDDQDENDYRSGRRCYS